MQTAVLLSIREKSTRLPKKVIRVIEGKTVCEHLIGRLKMASRPDVVIMATSVHRQDDILCEMAKASGIPCFRGSEEDKLVRYRDAAREFGFEFMVVVDGDDLFCSEEHIDAAVNAYESTGADFISQRGLPFGAASFGVRLGALDRVCAKKKQTDTEVWGALFTEDPEFRTYWLEESRPLYRRPEIRMSLDYQEDLDFFEAVFRALYRGQPLRFEDVMTYLDGHPEVVAMNQGVQERYERHLQKHLESVRKSVAT